MRKPLVLVPTSAELKILEDLIQPMILQAGGFLHLCGFGPIAAAARASQLLAEFQPGHVVLVGIAGAIGDELSVGSAWTFDEVACYGVGAGTGKSFTTAGGMGWRQWPEDKTAAASAKPISGDVLKLRHHAATSANGQPGRPRLLLTCCAASGDHSDVELKSDCFPDAVGEDMEGFGVAMACSLVNVPLTIVRGISNLAGDRDKSHWQIEQALEAAAQQVVRLIADGLIADHREPG